ncbi:MAG: protein-glutamate O-methyltransferase CheR [Gammaproteobacteria bacterium]|nr:protein-glutamate O-methyltransferase CheR [Gammaproteobacteria bacterium]
MNGPAVLDDHTFARFADLIYSEAGITLGSHKHSLVAARLGKRMRSLGIGRFEDYFAYVREDGAGGELVMLIDAISTNVTQFYREAVHFEILDTLLRRWRNEGQSRFRVWCAAASTGEEPYTLAITLAEALGDVSDVRILATDISTRALAAARRGRYEAKKVETVPREFLGKYFASTGSGSERFYQVREGLRRMLKFARLNLATPPFPMKGPLDVVFCRNVMIYFDQRVRQLLVDEIHRLLRPGGYLMVGHSESLTGLGNTFRAVKPSVYVKD